MARHDKARGKAARTCLGPSNSYRRRRLASFLFCKGRARRGARRGAPRGGGGNHSLSQRDTCPHPGLQQQAADGSRYSKNSCWALWPRRFWRPWKTRGVVTRLLCRLTHGLLLPASARAGSALPPGAETSRCYFWTRCSHPFSSTTSSAISGGFASTALIKELVGGREAGDETCMYN